MNEERFILVQILSPIKQLFLSVTKYAEDDVRFEIGVAMIQEVK